MKRCHETVIKILHGGVQSMNIKYYIKEIIGKELAVLKRMCKEREETS